MTADSNPVLGRLDALVGEWEMQMSIGEQTLSGGRATFEWIEDGAFLVYRGEAEETSELAAELGENSPLPTVSIIGVDDATEQFTMLYSDARGVFRVYEMTLNSGEWELWRDAQGFAQRFTGTFSDDGDTITGTWEKSEDGSDWEHDFDLSYVKVG
ncbi:hypothetical protein HWV07_11425 [Natronomonas salina]|uniref:hypothetical protein n=1 Tax=Natronomonas salina TaxID=1710540 RepID=UPI0015B55724|nr:hypothetical protein [Natronomonas salina]QLD89607.1 hypothetical protein HWV07_11425 [Natronomonas salina]